MNFTFSKNKINLIIILGILLFGILAMVQFNTIHSQGDGDVGNLTATVDTANVTDGDATLAPFDSDDEPGHDSSATNQIIRSYDNISVPLKISLSPKTSATQYTVTISGYIENGISHTNGVTRDVAYVPKSSASDTYAEDSANNRTTFSQTITTTATNFTSYLHIRALGAFNGSQFHPVVKVAFTAAGTQQAESAQSVTISDLPTYTVSSVETWPTQMTSSSFTPIGDNDTSVDAVNADQSTKNRLFLTGTGLSEGTLIHGSATKGSVIGTTMPATITMANEFSASLDYDSASGTLPTLKLDSSNFTRPTSMSGLSNSTGVNLTASVTPSGDSGVNVTLSNINLGFYDAQTTPTVVNYYYTDFFFFLNNYASGAPDNPNGISNIINFENNYKLSYTDMNGTTYTKSATDPNSNWQINNTVVLQPTFHYGFDEYFTNANKEYFQQDGDLKATTGSELRIAPYVTLTNKEQNIQTKFEGGYKAFYTFNPDAFEVSDSNLSKMTDQGTNVAYGVVKDTIQNPYTPAVQYGLTKDDFTWYDDYDTAKAAGTVSAVTFDKTSTEDLSAGVSIIGGDHLYLKSIGNTGATSGDNPNNIYYRLYLYSDSARSEDPIAVQNYDEDTPDETYSQSATVDDHGDFDSASGSSSRFFTVAFKNALVRNNWTESNFKPTQTSTVLSNSTTTMFSPAHSIAISELQGDQSYTLTKKITLPAGVRYVQGSSQYALADNDEGSFDAKYARTSWEKFPALSDPDVVINSDGVETLTWSIPISYDLLKNYSSDDAPETTPGLMYNVTFDDYSWTYTGNPPVHTLTTSAEVDSLVNTSESSTDSNAYQYNVQLVGRPSVSSSIDHSVGYPGSKFTVDTKPYTTVQAGDDDLMGLIPLPSNDSTDSDTSDSHFHGTVSMTALKLTAGSHTVDIYYTNSKDAAKETNPIDVDTSSGNSGGWTKYDPDTDDISVLKDATAIYYHIEGHMTNTDRSVALLITYQTADNNLADQYVHRSYINAPAYKSDGDNKSNVSPDMIYHIINDSFNGKVWLDNNADGLMTTDEPGRAGIHLQLFRKNSAGAWEKAPTYNDSGDNDATTATSGDDGTFSLVTNQPGEYTVGISKADIDSAKLVLADMGVGTDTKVNSHFDANTLVDGYYLANSSGTLPEEADATEANYTFDDFNGGLIPQSGDLTITAPNLYFGKHPKPKTAELYDNVGSTETNETPDNTVTITDTRRFADGPYELQVKVGDFTNDTSGSVVGLQAASIHYVQSGDGTAIAPINNVIALFDYDGNTPQTLTHTFANIQLSVPSASSTNVINSGHYHSTVTYSLTSSVS